MSPHAALVILPVAGPIQALRLNSSAGKPDAGSIKCAPMPGSGNKALRPEADAVPPAPTFSYLSMFTHDKS
jgi:hypothetical protein